MCKHVVTLKFRQSQDNNSAGEAAQKSVWAALLSI